MKKGLLIAALSVILSGIVSYVVAGKVAEQTSEADTTARRGGAYLGDILGAAGTRSQRFQRAGETVLP